MNDLNNKIKADMDLAKKRKINCHLWRIITMEKEEEEEV
jgi:hypothetical protein